MKAIASLIACFVVLSLAAPVLCQAEPSPVNEATREQRVKDLKELIAFNTIKSKDLRISPKATTNEIREILTEKINIYSKTAEYSLELAELTTTDKDQLASKKNKIITDLENIRSKLKAYLDKYNN